MLSMSAENFLDRRLQTIVWRLGLAKSVHHARVLIKQGHIRVGKQIVNVPSFLVRKDSERHIDFALNSPFGGGRPGRNKRKALASKVSPNPCPLLRASGRPGRPRERTTPPEPAPGAEDGRGCGRHGVGPGLFGGKTSRGPSGCGGSTAAASLPSSRPLPCPSSSPWLSLLRETTEPARVLLAA